MTRSGALAAGTVALFATLVALVLALGTGAYPVLGLPDPGVPVRLAVPLLRGAAALAAAGCLGAFVQALLLHPRPAGPAGPVGPSGPDRAGPDLAVLRRASLLAVVWAVLGLGVAIALGADTGDTSALDGAGELAVALVVRPGPLGWVATAVLGGLVAVWSREARTWSSAAGCGVLAAAGLLGPVVTGHAVDGVGHDLGLPATALHVVAATLWLGTLGAALGTRDDRARARARRITVGCAVAVLATGVIQALVLVGTGRGWVTPYGLLVLASVVLTVVVVALRARPGGANGVFAPQERAERAVRSRRGGGLLGEVVLLGVVLGLSVALTRAIPPVQAPGSASSAQAVLGYALDAPPTVATLLTSWRPDLVLGVLAVALAALYALGLRRAPGWPRGRSVCWFAGCAVLVLATSSGLGRYGPAVLSVHVAGHMLVSTVVPFLLVLGGPLTLARRALPEDDDDREGPRDWLEHVVDAPALRLATHPLVATVLMVGSPFLLYLTPLFSLTAPLGWLQPLINLWFLGVGLAFAWMLVGVDPAPRPLPWVARLAVLLASMPFHALFGVLLLTAGAPISRTPPTLSTLDGGGQVQYGDFFQRLRLPWAATDPASLVADQHVAAYLTWAMGDLPLVVVVVVLLVQWQRAATAEDRAAREGLLTVAPR